MLLKRESVHVCTGLLLCLTLIPWAEGAPPTHHPFPQAAESVGPQGPPSTLLMEVSTGEVLQATGPHRRFPPASLDKLMTLYLTLQAIRAGRLTMDSAVTVSVTAWKVGRTPGSSRMFLNAGDTVTVSQLLEGLMIASGNDAAEALAETIAGSGEQFVEEMNAEASRLGMGDTHFVTPHGLPSPGEYTSAADMALLARRILLDYPDVVRFSRPRAVTYAGIRQANWNNLVFRGPVVHQAHVDGLKTGHTREAGYSIVATAQDEGMRLIAVVMGAPTLQRRTALAEGLLRAGFVRYALTPVPWQTTVPAAIRIYGGATGRLRLETTHPVAVLTSRDAHLALDVSEEITVRPFAPFRRGEEVGRLSVSRDGRVISTTPLLAASAVERTGMLGRIWGYLRYAAGRLLRRHPAIFRGTVTVPGK
jgi:D-alanyl-D-alanine carboxypeptidase (penicillin-binding protein 5/6)